MAGTRAEWSQASAALRQLALPAWRGCAVRSAFHARGTLRSTLLAFCLLRRFLAYWMFRWSLLEFLPVPPGKSGGRSRMLRHCPRGPVRQTLGDRSAPEFAAQCSFPLGCGLGPFSTRVRSDDTGCSAAGVLLTATGRKPEPQESGRRVGPRPPSARPAPFGAGLRCVRPRFGPPGAARVSGRRSPAARSPGPAVFCYPPAAVCRPAAVRGLRLVTGVCCPWSGAGVCGGWVRRWARRSMRAAGSARLRLRRAAAPRTSPVELARRRESGPRLPSRSYSGSGLSRWSQHPV